MPFKRQRKGVELKIVFARVRPQFYQELCDIMEREGLESFGLAIEKLLTDACSSKK